MGRSGVTAVLNKMFAVFSGRDGLTTMVLSAVRMEGSEFRRARSVVRAAAGTLACSDASAFRNTESSIVDTPRSNKYCRSCVTALNELSTPAERVKGYM